MSSLLRVIFDPDTTPPGVPTILSVLPVGQGRLDVTWTAVTDTGGAGLAGYDLLIDGATTITLGIQTSYSHTGLAASSSHTYRVRARDAASPLPNISGYSVQVGGTVAAAPAVYNPDYPRFGSYAVGGTQNASNAALAECHVNILAYGATWAQRKGVTLEAKAAAVKALSTIGTKILPYVIHVDALDSWATPNNDFYEWYTVLTQNQWFVYNNGLTHDTKVVGSATGWSKPNYTTACPLVSGDTAFTWKAKWDYRLLYSGGTFSNGVTTVTVAGTSSLDGKYDDNIFARERSNGDYNVDGASELVSSAANISLIQASHAANLAYWRTLTPSDALAMANCADWPIWYPGGLSGLPLDQLYDGGVMENIDDFINGTRASTASALFGAIKVCQDAFRGPKLGMLEIQVTAATNYAQLRYWHCIAALTGTYYYPHVSSGYLAEELGTINYDERGFNLGPALTDSTGAVQWTPRYQSGSNGAGIYRRDFANGIVLWAAPGATYSSQALGGTFYRLFGSLDSATNSGQSLTSVTMTAGTGLVLARVSQDIIAPSTPTSLAASAISASQINLSWNASTDTGGSGLSTYRIERSANGTSGWSEIGTATTTNYSDSGLLASTQYFYRVRARDGVGNNSGYSSVANATTQAAGPVVGQQVQNLVLLDDFATWRTANNGTDKYFDIYNGATGDAGPNQSISGVSGNALQIIVPSGNVMYVDADCAPYTSLNQWLQGHIKSGTWNDGINRLSLLLRSTISQSRDSGGSANFNFGTYTKPRTNLSPGAEGTAPQNGHHYYHSVNTAITPNRWLKMVFPNCPDHERGDSGGADQNVILNYFPEMTRCYFTPFGYYPGNPSSTWQIAAIQLFRVDGEPDNEIRSLTIHYDGSKYQVTWCGRKNVSRTYEIRYRTDGVSMKTAGFTSGTAGGTGSFGGTGGLAFNPGNDYSGCFWDSPAMAESSNGIHVGIRVQGATQFHELHCPNGLSPSNTGFVGV